MVKDLKVWDLTDPNNKKLLIACGNGNEWSGGYSEFVNQVIALDSAANRSYEDDMFNILHQLVVGKKIDIHGVFRRTYSSTLQKNAEEFVIFKEYVEDSYSLKKLN